MRRAWPAAVLVLVVILVVVMAIAPRAAAADPATTGGDDAAGWPGTMSGPRLAANLADPTATRADRVAERAWLGGERRIAEGQGAAGPLDRADRTGGRRPVGLDRAAGAGVRAGDRSGLGGCAASRRSPEMLGLRESPAPLARPSCSAADFEPASDAGWPAPELVDRRLPPPRRGRPRAWPWLVAGGGALAAGLVLAAADGSPAAGEPRAASAVSAGSAVSIASTASMAIGALCVGTGVLVLVSDRAARADRPRARRRAGIGPGPGLVGLAYRAEL